MFEVHMAAVGNPDFNEPARLPGVPDVTVPVANLDDAVDTCREFIEQYDLGGGNWIGGQVYDSGKQVARVHYNGRVAVMDLQYWNRFIAYAGRYLADGHDATDPTNDSMREAFKACVLPARPEWYPMIREAILRGYGHMTSAELDATFERVAP